MKTVIVLLCLLLTMPLFAQYDEWHGIRYKTGGPDFDGWSIMHFGSGTLMYGSLRLLKINPVRSAIGVILGSFVYEIWKDGLGNQIPLTGGRDYHGADFKGDVMWTSLGGLFGVVLEAAFKLIDCKVVIVKKKVMLSFNF